MSSITLVEDLQFATIAHALHGGALDTHGLDDIALVELLQLLDEQRGVVHVGDSSNRRRRRLRSCITEQY